MRPNYGMLNADRRPKKSEQLYSWAPGTHLNKCKECSCFFVGAKFCRVCADCEYSKDVTKQEPTWEAN